MSVKHLTRQKAFKNTLKNALKYILNLNIENQRGTLPKKKYMELLEESVDTCNVLLKENLLNENEKKDCEDIIKILEDIHKEWFLLDDNGNPIKADKNNREAKTDFSKDMKKIIIKEVNNNPFSKGNITPPLSPPRLSIENLTILLEECKQQVKKLEKEKVEKLEKGGKRRKNSHRKFKKLKENSRKNKRKTKRNA